MVVEAVVLDGHDCAEVGLGKLARAHVAVRAAHPVDGPLHGGLLERGAIHPVAPDGYDGGCDERYGDKDRQQAAQEAQERPHGPLPSHVPNCDAPLAEKPSSRHTKE